MISPRNNAVDIRLEGGFIAIVKRGEFDSLLREDARVKGAQLIEAGFSHFAEKGKQITALVNINGKEEQIRTDYLIAADGVNSRVRLALGLKLSPAVYTLTTKIKRTMLICVSSGLANHMPASHIHGSFLRLKVYQQAPAVLIPES